MDVVIPVNADEPELRYCIRSIAENVPHRRVYLAGYRPAWASPELGHIDVPRVDSLKFLRVMRNIRMAVKSPEISDNFYLFNDDFFIMKPLENLPNYHRGELIDRGRNPGVVENTIKLIKSIGVEEPLDFGLHVPMIMNKDMWLEAWTELRKLELRPVHFRSFYGNYHKIDGEFMDDVKLYENNDTPTGAEQFLSTDNESFNRGLIGEYLRKRFNEPCKYERAD